MNMRLENVKNRFEKNVKEMDRQLASDFWILFDEIHQRDILISDFREQITDKKKYIDELLKKRA